MSDAREEKQKFEWIQKVFESASELPRGSLQERHIRDECGSEEEVVQQVQRLLRTHYRIAARNAGELPRFGPYQSVGVLGRGGAGIVYDAYRIDGEFERRVAVKVIADGSFADFVREDLLRERRILAKLEHPGIARLFDGGVAQNGSPYLITEFIDGIHLDQYCKLNCVSAKVRLALLLDVLDAVEYAHSNGVIHRDLKPSNILVGVNGRTKLVDFGAARFPSESGLTIHSRSYTPEYASPELMSGRHVDERGDIYSLGVLYGKLMGNQANSKVIQSATAFRVEDRYGSIAEFRKALEARAWPKRFLGICFVLALMAAFWPGSRVVEDKMATSPIHFSAVQGSPRAQGWRDAGGVISGKLVEDGPVTAWRMEGNDCCGYWFRGISDAHWTVAFERGWSLHGKLKVVGTAGYVYLFLNSKSIYPRFDLHLGNDGVKGWAGFTKYTDAENPDIKTSFEINEYHYFDMRYDPKTKSAGLWLDGIQVLSGYKGHSLFREGHGPAFGASGNTTSLLIQHVEFTIR